MILPAWIPPMGASVLGSLLSALFAWRVASARVEVKTAADIQLAETKRASDLKRADDLRAADAQRAEELKAELRELKLAWHAGIDRVQSLAENIAGLQGTQNQVNVFTAKALESLTEKVDRHDAALGDHTASIRLLIDRVMSSKA